MDNQNPKYCLKCGNEVNGEFCSECGTPIGLKIDEEYVSLKDSGWQPISDYLSSNDFNVWHNGIKISLIIWGLINLVFAPFFGIIFIFLGIFIYFFKSLNLIILFSSIWLLVALYQLYFGFSNLNALYIIAAVINILFSFYVMFKVNRFKELPIHQLKTNQ